MVKGQILTYIYWMLGLLVLFVGIFVFFSIKIKRDDLTEEAEGLKQMGEKHRRMKAALTDSERKAEIMEHFLSMSEEARKEILEQLEDQADKKKLG